MTALDILRPGQVWRYLDPRWPTIVRVVRIVRGTYVVCDPVGPGRRRRIHVGRFRPYYHGLRPVLDADGRAIGEVAIEPKRCARCDRVAHAGRCRPRRARSCARCGAGGHTARRCPLRRRMRCGRCGEIGHNARRHVRRVD